MDLLLSDFDNFSENSSCEDQDDAEFMYGGQARSILSSLEETIGKIDDFLSFERGFIYGDIVCLVTDPSGQTGRVINVDMIVDLENVDGKKIDNVNSKKLRKIRSVSVGDYVVNGPWLGKVDKIVDYVTILFDDGRKCEFTSMGPEKLVPISPDLLEDSQYPYYPGQRVQVEPSSVVKSSRRLCGTWKEKRDEGTVCAVEAGLVYVDWLACALVGGEKVPAPPCVQDSKNLTLLSCFSHANWQLGDWCMLPLHEYNCVTEKFSLKASTCGLTKGHHQPAKAFQRSLEPNFQEIFVIARTKTKVDVLWQDGSQSFGLDSHLLIPVNITDAHDFWPEQFVLEKGNSDDLHASGVQKWGVVRCVDAKERTMRVKWRSFSANQATDLKEELVEETMSAYELIEHPEYSYFFGEVVFRLQKGQFVDLPDGKSYGNSYLSCIGIVVGFKDGDVEVKWASGHTTKVAPHEIFRLDKYEDLSATPVLHEEMTEHDNQSLGQKGKALLDSNGDSKYGQKSSWVSSSFSLPQATIGFFTSIASSLFGSSGFTSLLGTSDHVFEDGQQSGISSEEEVVERSNLCTVGPTLAVADWPKVEEIQDNREIPFSSVSKHQELFKQFDMVSGCSDHHFVDGAGKGLISSQVKRGWLKKVQQEWSILEKDLPETIYVRIYEERMDLIRAAIVGAPGTPYHDGLFIFDIFLPPDYPHEPPLVHYNSGGLRVNPNLYESGKVCLSLLNTWTGTGTETWSPENSTILQVLLSLQALVLNEKPYFNEAGYDKQMGRAEGEKNSVSYNENAFLVSSKTMLHLMRKPPKHFELLVEEHFSRRSEYIILACKAYMEGVPVGCAFGHENAEEENQKGSSTGFKIMLAKLFPMLVEAFSDKGIDCSKYIESPK